MGGLLYIWYTEATGRAAVPPSPILAVPNVTETAHPYQRPVYQLHIIRCGTIIASNF